MNDLIALVDKLIEKHTKLRDGYYGKHWDGLGLEENLKVHALREIKKELQN